jgi:hypothetical protein
MPVRVILLRFKKIAVTVRCGIEIFDDLLKRAALMLNYTQGNLDGFGAAASDSD